MLFDRVQLCIDDRTAVEGPDRQRDLKRLDQKSHANRRTAGSDGEADAARLQAPHRALGAFGQDLVFGQEGAVDIRDDEGDAGHDRFLLLASLSAGLSLSPRTMSSTMVSTGASIDTVTGFSSASGGSRVLNWLSNRSGGMKWFLRAASRPAINCCVPFR